MTITTELDTAKRRLASAKALAASNIPAGQIRVAVLRVDALTLDVQRFEADLAAAEQAAQAREQREVEHAADIDDIARGLVRDREALATAATTARLALLALNSATRAYAQTHADARQRLADAGLTSGTRPDGTIYPTGTASMGDLRIRGTVYRHIGESQILGRVMHGVAVTACGIGATLPNLLARARGPEIDSDLDAILTDAKPAKRSTRKAA